MNTIQPLEESAKQLHVLAQAKNLSRSAPSPAATAGSTSALFASEKLAALAQYYKRLGLSGACAKRAATADLVRRP